MHQRSLAILQAPSALGLRTDGVASLGVRLMELGLGRRLGARDAGALDVPARQGRGEAGILNPGAIAAFAPQLADAIEAILDIAEFPIVLGGDCTILLGSMLAFRRRGRYGLLFIDGHADFFQPEAEPNGEGASMDLAWATGYGPAAVTDIEGRRPLVRPEDTVVFGFRDHEDQEEFGGQPLPAEMLVFDLPRLHEVGVEAAARAALERLARSELDGFFIHCDADVLDDALMPAVDFRIPGGLSWDELVAALRIALDSNKAMGLEVTIYNPSLDKDGAAGRGLVNALGRAFS